MSDEHRVAGLLLAAGAGTRMGAPKALVRGESGEAWVVRGARVLLDSGCSPVVVVVGARATEVSQVLGAGIPGEPRLVVRHAERWSEGMAASLRAGLSALSTETTDAVVVTLVDTPSLRVETIERLRAEGTIRGQAVDALVQATFGGRPGHPVVIGSAHWGPLAAELDGDVGARDYLRERGARRVECGDLEPGNDVDSPSDLI
ncbi:nucleotidyltransferase family protein [Subtercola boreus]|uniref:MobA-like NTP transferase domain-containing protein n=1 Tax=Subtercola boreus TaxID=120213 RepID=A0A3E0WEN4_9MICO|nr:nucleotidyltransferase family protein [Subtercola boreus]RFA22419.1 hypothetical protein B7R24_04565 [Subtercola boreus]RFA22481.1 hypothetical protein B7R23_04560 [Subtercola boreus]RFA28496.1 hypothetical protein B7R25_04575 [Subtercola boreus]